MIVIEAQTVNDALCKALSGLESKGQLRSSRNGTVLAFPTPVSTVYKKPEHRVLFSPMRNVNHAFHLVESLWMLAGRRDVKFPATFVKNMKSFTDDGETFWGAYGHRWRQFFGWDQISAAITELRSNPESRRVVIAMWNGMESHECGVTLLPDFIAGVRGGLDVPCNTHIYFDRRDGKLNMTVCCRSNDILWGCYGANVVHMSVLQEYMALSIGCPVGTYTQMSNDLHLYNSKMPEQGLKALSWDIHDHDFYWHGPKPFKATPLWGDFEDRAMFDRDINLFFQSFDTGGITRAIGGSYETKFFNGVVIPVVKTWSYRMVPDAAQEAASHIMADDWRTGMEHWLAVRSKK